MRLSTGDDVLIGGRYPRDCFDNDYPSKAQHRTVLWLTPCTGRWLTPSWQLRAPEIPGSLSRVIQSLAFTPWRSGFSRA